MRPRFVVLGTVVTMLLAVAAPSVVTAAPRHNHGLTINVTPKPILAGEGVLIYGQLDGAQVAGQTIVLYHHLAGFRGGYTKVGQTKTDAHGFYEFTRAENVVDTNRSWFVRVLGVHAIHSRTVTERVSPLVSLTTSTTNPATGQSVVFTGHVAPNHSGEVVLLQQQIGSSDDWRTLDAGRIGPGSSYSIAHRFKFAGDRDVRALFVGDARNIRGASDPLTVTIEQRQLPGLTVSSSAALIDYQQPVTISGVVANAPNTALTLWAWTATQNQFVPVIDTTTDKNGSYTFPVQMPSYNTVYQVRTTLAPRRHSAMVFEGVRDAVSLTASATTASVGDKITLVGNVFPDKTGHVIYLQRLGSDGDWHNVEVRAVEFGSTVRFDWSFGKAGIDQFRARITGDHDNVGGASAPVTIQVTPPTSPTALPPAS